MILKRRYKPTVLQRIRTWLWPRRSWSRSLRYFVLRLERLQASPHQVALGCAAGVFASITPLLGTQMLLAAGIAAAIRASIPAALIGTFFGNPVSWPVIWAATYAAGCNVLGVDALLAAPSPEYIMAPLAEAVIARSPQMLDTALTLVWPIFKSMLAGSLLLGTISAVAIYYLLRPAVSAYQKNRAMASASAI